MAVEGNPRVETAIWKGPPPIKNRKSKIENFTLHRAEARGSGAGKKWLHPH
jgi:hypothetical protein